MFDMIGDIHGCYDELTELLSVLGYSLESGIPIHPDGRSPVFVGDGMDRGPDSLRVLQLLFALQDSGKLHYSPGNHCNKLYRYAKGNNVQQTHGLETTVAELDALPPDERQAVLSRYRRFYEKLPLYLSLDGGSLIVAHAGLPERMIGAKPSGSMKTFVLYGDVTGETLPDGRPVRRDWAASYKGNPWIVYGHTPVREPRFTGNTVNIDTGCVFGGSLTAFRWPEKEIVSVPSRQPFQPEKFTDYSS
ncbi:bis(5'-nucleosyl)-tetraphosphatase PrpE [asymmetrical] [Sporosarcina sp. NCCP-2716]|uniref:bis(5'-nucleosyl)-tetraphosphatase PrpE n=1 Tax=Sporosarcina sp. NCCP-2716 TaxID=2943679 RepID=UPI002041611E|nr:bis(5'-nucleosyl)-tetraphosphatase PrpE [Sporosarcina sp. NCCP-2716]GKV67583.1 bis(5'-nucleosyl)-tetraphosphatase PrpE [asymmetrical] [Sporosarcina sp. NCCP-2716]